MNKQQLASRIWASANKMRSTIEANEYKDYILGFIFYKYLSEQEEKVLRKRGYTTENIKNKINEDNKKVMEFLQDKLGYFISYDNLFSTWLTSSDINIGYISDALNAFERLISPKYRKLFGGIFLTLSSGLSKLGPNVLEQSKAAADIISLINDIPMDGKQGYDVLGFIYEYLIGKFAATAGKKAGEFYTPHEVSVLMSEIVAYCLRGRNEIKIYDPTSGSGSLLINIGKSAAKHMRGDSFKEIKYYAQELKQNTYNITRMNLIMRGIQPENIDTRNADTLEADWPKDPSNMMEPLTVDAVVSNPPYSQSWNNSDKMNDKRFRDYGVAPTSKADLAFLLHDLYHINHDGVVAIVLPHGVLFRGGEEAGVRINLIERNNIDAIIGLPPNIFFGTGIPTIIMILRKNRDSSDVLFIDASKGFVKDGNSNKLRACDIKNIYDAYVVRADKEKFCRSVPKSEIVANEYNLNIPRYIDSSEDEDHWDIYSSIYGGIPNSEIAYYNKYWNVLLGLKENLFRSLNDQYSEISVSDVENTVLQNQSVKVYISKFNEVFKGFKEYLCNELISDFKLDINIEEDILGKELFSRIDKTPLIDKYIAYQMLDDAWSEISQDIEVIQTEGLEQCRVLVDNIVLKKNKKGEIVESTKGYLGGRIFSFELIEDVYLQAEKNDIKALSARFDGYESEFNDIIESITEEDIVDHGGLFDEENKLIPKNVTAYTKKLQFQDAFDEKMINYVELQKKIKNVKSEINSRKSDIQQKTIEIIRNLTEDQIKELLEKKWIDPFVSQLYEMPYNLMKQFSVAIKKLSEKYQTTLSDIDSDIYNISKELAGMLNELTGSEYDMKAIKELQALLER